MEIIKINKNKISKKEIGLIADFLKEGKVIVYPTDTIYGLGCLATNRKAVNKIFAIKKREKKYPFLLLIGSWKMAKDYFLISSSQKNILKKFWPGKVSVILHHKNILPGNIFNNLTTGAVRLPKDDFLVKIIKAAGAPIVSTSLNLSSQPHLEDLSEIANYFKEKQPDIVLDSGVKKGKPSKLIDLTGEKPVILRK